METYTVFRGVFPLTSTNNHCMYRIRYSSYRLVGFIPGDRTSY
jgi:hypothetical protein